MRVRVSYHVQSCTHTYTQLHAHLHTNARAAMNSGTLLEQAHILFQHGPFGAVVTQGVAAMGVDLDKRVMGESGLFQTQGLTAGARAEFN